MRTPSPKIVLVLAMLLALPGIAAAAEEKKTEKKESALTKAAARSKAAQTDDAVVFTNEDLERRYGPVEKPVEKDEKDEKKAAPQQPTGSSAAATTSGDQKPSGDSAEKPADSDDPLALMKAQQEREVERRRLIGEAEAKVTAARERISALEKRNLANSNPFLARPKAPEKEEDREKWEAMDGAQRREQSNQELATAREDLRKAEQELANLRSGR